MSPFLFAFCGLLDLYGTRAPFSEFHLMRDLNFDLGLAVCPTICESGVTYDVNFLDRHVFGCGVH